MKDVFRSKKLGFGLMRLPQTDEGDSTKIDHATVCAMADRFMAAGFTYFDTAAPYHGTFSEVALRECVVKRYPRESFTITDKLTGRMVESADKLPAFFQGQLERCGVDYFDVYLIHALSKSGYEHAQAIGAFEFAARMKAEGKVRHVGFSFHDTAEVLEQILTDHPEVEVVQLQLNYIDWEDPDVQSRKNYEVCVKHGKPVIVMEPVKGGLLANVPPEVETMLTAARPGMSPASWAIRFAASLDNVAMVLSGMTTVEQMEDNLSYMTDFQPLDQTEAALPAQAAAIIKSKERFACTGCRYCVDGCPMQIPIPSYFRLMNQVSMYGPQRLEPAKKSYARMAEKGGLASVCVKCGACEASCPQHLPIRDYLEDVARELEG